MPCSSPATRRDVAEKFAGTVRTRLGEELQLIDAKRFEFCWIVDFPMYEFDEEAKKIEFQPQSVLDAAGRNGRTTE